MNRSRAVLWLTLWFVLQMGLHFAVVVIPAVQQGGDSFAGYYTASWLMARGEFTSLAYSNDWFAAQVPIAMQDPTASEVISPNLPTVGFAVLPLVAFHPALAQTMFTLTSWLVSWVALAIVVWRTRPVNGGGTERGWIIGGMLLVWSSPFIANLWIGQIYSFLFFALVLVWVACSHNRNVVAGAVFGIAFMLKSTGSLLFLLPVIYRRFGFWVGLGIVIAGLGLASLFWIQPQTWATYLEAVGIAGNRPWVAVTAYQTTLGMLSHLFRYDADWNPTPIMNLSVLVRPLYILITGVAVVWTGWILYHSKAAIGFGMALLLILSVISVPFAEEYHFLLIFLPLLLVVQQVRESQGQARLILGILITLIGALLLLPLPYEHPRLSAGWLAFFAYPRLYGTWLLWGVGCYVAMTPLRQGSAN